MSGCRQCNIRNITVREDEATVRRLARVIQRTDNPTTLTKVKLQLAEAKRQLTRARDFRDEHAAECGALR